MQHYSRSKPSPRYQRLLALYREMHREGETVLGIPPDQTFPGKSLPPPGQTRVEKILTNMAAWQARDVPAA